MLQKENELSNTDRARLDLVIELSRLSNCRRAKHAASVYKGGRLLASGLNKTKTNNKWINGWEGRPASVHAEIAALNQIEDARGCVLYVARTLKDGTPSMSKPCQDCETEIIRRGVKKVCYTIDGIMEF